MKPCRMNACFSSSAGRSIRKKMRDERGKISGDLTISEPYTLWGSLAGNVSVVEGGKFYLRGSIYGNVVVEPGGRAHLLGNVSENLTVCQEGKAILGGALG